MVKRLIDITVSAAALVLLAPLLGLIAAAILLETGCPVIFNQERVGCNFRRFRIYKFRTMRLGQAGPQITVAGDRRVTHVGWILRAWKLDELPQLWNVLKGDMSLVGPRPELPEYVERFRERYERILTVRPGITDLASVRFRREERDLAWKPDPLRAYVEEIRPAKLDLAEGYVRGASLLLDFSILLKTVVVTLGFGQGKPLNSCPSKSESLYSRNGSKA